MKIRICGSMNFYKEYERLKKELEARGHKVIIPLPDEAYSKEENIKRKAMEVFNTDLKKSDSILIMNFDKDNKINHIGVNSLMEIGMAFILNKKIFLYNKIPEFCREELEAIKVIELNGDLDKIR